MLLFALCMTHAFGNSASKDSSFTIAVYPLSCTAAQSINARIITDRIENRILSLTGYRLISASRLPSLRELGDGQYSVLRKCPVHVDRLCIGSLENGENDVTFTLKLVDIPTSRVIAVGQKQCDGTERRLIESADSLVNELIVLSPAGKEVNYRILSDSTDACVESDTHASDSLQILQNGMVQWEKIALGGFALLSMMMLLTFSSQR